MDEIFDYLERKIWNFLLFRKVTDDSIAVVKWIKRANRLIDYTGLKS